ncbi:MAG: hypothetical protein ACYSWS_00835 [Planctomycetota bacterium]|jgi:hypothetical protein
MPAQYFKVPEKYGGMSVRDIHNQLLRSGLGTGVGDLGTFAKFLGVSETEPLQTGRTFGTTGFAPQYIGTSSEWKGLTRAFDPTTSPEETRKKAAAEAFQEAQRKKTEEFTGRLQEIPTQLAAIRKALGLPELYQTQADVQGEARRQALESIGLPGKVEGETTQAAMGKDVSAGQLKRMIGSRFSEARKSLEPAAAITAMKLGDVGSALQSAVGQYGVETGLIFKPLEIEAGILGAQSAQEFDLYKSTMKNELDLELQKLQNASAMDIERLRQSGALDQLNKTAEIEDKYAGISFQNLGDVMGIYKGTEKIGEESFGLKPTRSNDGKPPESYLTPNISTLGTPTFQLDQGSGGVDYG